MIVDDNVSSRLRKLREDKKLSQREFAVELGISASAISEIERGARDPSRKLLVSIYNRFGYDPNWILFGLQSDKITAHEMRAKDDEIRYLKKSIDTLERENKELSKELLDRMRKIIDFRPTPSEIS